MSADTLLERAEYFPRLQCGLLRALVDFERHTVVLYLPPDECTDMSGAIQYASELDPDVCVIQTIAGEVQDTRYVLAHDGWRAA